MYDLGFNFIRFKLKKLVAWRILMQKMVSGYLEKSYYPTGVLKRIVLSFFMVN